MYETHEYGERFLTPQGDAAKAFELIEEAFDLMPLFVEPSRWAGRIERISVAAVSQ